MSTVFPIHRVVVPNRAQPRALRPLDVLGFALRLIDLATVAAAAACAHLLTAGKFGLQDDPLMLVTTLLVSLIAFSSVRLYDTASLLRPGGMKAGRLAGAWLGVIAISLSLVYLIKPGQLPDREYVSLWGGLGIAGLVGTRLVVGAWVARLHREGQLGWNVVVLGSGGWGRAVRAQLEANHTDARVVGFLELGDTADFADLEGAVRQHLKAKPVDLVALALDGRSVHRVPEVLAVLRDFPVEVGVLPQVAGADVPTLGYRRLGDLTSVTCMRKPIDGWSWHLKSAFDRVAATCLLLFLAPLLAIIAIGVKTTSAGPVFFRQARLGFNQRPVKVYKFRSMYTDRCDVSANDVRHATRNDPRVTPFGAFLRKTSLDELPQLLNVLRGDMSLVGPRPHAVAHDEYYASLIDGYLGRHRAKPGITGWAQVNGHRGEIFSLEDMRRRIELDLFYIDNWSLWLDIKILLHTVFVVFHDKQAY